MTAATLQATLPGTWPVPRFRVSLVREPTSIYADSPACGQPSSLARIATAMLDDAAQEKMIVIVCDARHQVIGTGLCYQGTLSRAAVEPRTILQYALLLGGASVAIAHNHPSGDPSPSAEDLLFTRYLHTACDAVGLKLLDHLIIGDAGRWVSLRERNAW